MVFGIGTESNNALGSAIVLPIDASTLSFTTTFENITMPDSFIDSGSNVLYFDSNDVAECTDSSGLYCPTTTANLSAVNAGTSGSASVHFSVQNGDALLNALSSGDAALPGLAAPANNNGTGFDWGLPFFYGRNVYTSIAGSTAPGGTTPYWAYPPN
jgi:hypothetical protein